MQAVGDLPDNAALTMVKSGHPNAARGIVLIGDLRSIVADDVEDAATPSGLGLVQPSFNVGNSWTFASATATDAKD